MSPAIAAILLRAEKRGPRVQTPCGALLAARGLSWQCRHTDGDFVGPRPMDRQDGQ